MPSSLDSLNLEGAKSEELRSIIASVSEATASDGSPRYNRRVISILTRALVCRTYAKLTLELSHFVAAISDGSGRFEHILWGVDRAQARLFRTCLAECDWFQNNTRITEQGIIHQTGDDVFLVSYTRMPVLTVFVEFLISALGYKAVDEITSPVRTGTSTAKQVGEVANALQRALYAFLKDHLPPAHRQRRERHFLDYVDERSGNRRGADAITDDAVLGYWQAFATDADFDNKTYRSVYEMSFRLVIALDAAAERVQGTRAVSVGTDREAGEIDPEDVEAIIAAFDPDETPLARLMEKCGDTIKVLTATEAGVLGLLPLRPNVERRMPVSVIRNAVQGALQLKLSSVLRQGRSMTDRHQKDTALYLCYLKSIKDIVDVLDRVLAAALWILYSEGHSAAISVALEIAPDIHWGALAVSSDTDETDSVADLNIYHLMQKFFETIPDKRGGEVQGLLADARVAYRGVNRKGFAGRQTSEVTEALADTTAEIVSLVAAIRRYIEREASKIDWGNVEREDALIFQSMFRKLYGDAVEVTNNGG